MTSPGLALLLLCFFLSGFAALLYETAWAREFAAVFGTSELAVVSVLAAYMAGLAAGAASAGRWVRRVRRPIRVYAVLELGIAASALAVPWALHGATALRGALFGGRAEIPDEAHAAGALFHVVSAFAILMIPTGLMGATLPLLARHAVRRDDEIGSRVGALYALNTAGAVLGALATGFVLLPWLGLRLTVGIGAGVNLLVFAMAALLARRVPLAEVGSRAPAAAPFHWVLPLVAASGAVSFTYEVLWTRLLGQLLGGSVQGFATMLASFLLGIALGSAVAARLARDAGRAARGFVVAQLGVALLSLAAFAGVESLPELARQLGAGRGGPAPANAAIALLGLLPGALCIGAVFPFAVRLVARRPEEAAPAAARVYAWNTVGAISGALAGGFVLLPALRFAGTMQLAAGLNLAVALCAALWARPRQRVGITLAAVAGAWLWLAPPQTPWAVLRFNGDGEAWSGAVTYYAVGRSATVTLFEEPRGWRLIANGLPESRIDRPGPWPDRTLTARWLGLLPVLLRPEARSVLVVGLGAGHSVEAVPDTVARVRVIELEREMLGAHARLRELRGHSPLADPRVGVVINDARGGLQLSRARFDAIVSQPSHPWTAGASHLYTREFFSLVARHLEPGGVFVQWIGLEYVDRALLGSLMAALLESFPHVALFQPMRGSVLFAASAEPLEPLAGAARALGRSPQAFERYGLRSPEDLAARWVLDSAGARRLAGRTPPNSDDRNRLAARSAGLGRDSLRAGRGLQIAPGDDPLRDRVEGLDPVALVRGLLARSQTERALRVAGGLGDPVQRDTALGWALAPDSPARAARHFRRALRADPGADAARFGLLRVQRRFDEPDRGTLPEVEAALDEGARAVVQGWRLAARGQWPELAALEPRLARPRPAGPLRADALGLRVLWRAASPDPDTRDEAVEIAAAMLRSHPAVDAAWPAAGAFAAVGRSDDALRALGLLSRAHPDGYTARAGLALLDALPDDVDAERRAGVRRRLSRRLR